MRVLACVEYDEATDTCTTEAWVVQPGLLPPLPAAEGLQLSSIVLAMCASAWGLKYVRRYLDKRA